MTGRRKRTFGGDPPVEKSLYRSLTAQAASRNRITIGTAGVRGWINVQANVATRARSRPNKLINRAINEPAISSIVNSFTINMIPRVTRLHGLTNPPIEEAAAFGV